MKETAGLRLLPSTKLVSRSSTTSTLLKRRLIILLGILKSLRRSVRSGKKWQLHVPQLSKQQRQQPRQPSAPVMLHVGFVTRVSR